MGDSGFQGTIILEDKIVEVNTAGISTRDYITKMLLLPMCRMLFAMRVPVVSSYE
jgi:hypothetical protein